MYSALLYACFYDFAIILPYILTLSIPDNSDGIHEKPRQEIRRGFMPEIIYLSSTVCSVSTMEPGA